MKQKLFIFILMTLFLPVMASAESEKVTVNGYNYTIITDDYYAYVTGGASGSTVISIPSSITYKNQSYEHYVICGLNTDYYAFSYD